MIMTLPAGDTGGLPVVSQESGGCGGETACTGVLSLFPGLAGTGTGSYPTSFDSSVTMRFVLPAPAVDNNDNDYDNNNNNNKQIFIIIFIIEKTSLSE